ncbi:helix-turn-helix transcriptional regulator [Serratia plymuthica]|uniref:response regulator transcription factor n=1 Tax=Serratia plymuthica TaxID=82996 RepID=UPI001927878F|nr:LuxR C-terminal-related transcriptional regulator [Serratia plymuthica]MBL3523563.1 helix-turn-helix transcriptional regulator [Serratia plymuthica]
MDNNIMVAIVDENRYFVLGLKYALLEYFSLKGKHVEFPVLGKDDIAMDLVFLSLNETEVVSCCNLEKSVAGFRSKYIAIRKKKADPALREKACIRELGVLDFNTSINALFSLLDEKLWRITEESKVSEPCSFCMGRILSGREKEVMSYLRLGVNQTQAAKYMQLSVKTVHTYKQSAMRKLNFRRRSDLYNWLLRI